MGGKGSSQPQSTNDAVVAMQEKEAAQATTANQERNARLNYGKQNIEQTFEGTLAGSSPLDFSGITQANAKGVDPTTTANVNATLDWAYAHPEDSSYIPGLQAQLTGPKQTLANGYSWGQMADDGSGTPQYGLYDPQGNLVNSGSISDIAASKIYSVPAGTTPQSSADTAINSAFGPDFYNKFTNSILDYYLPQEDQQYADARTQLNYGLARSGGLDSSVASMDIAKLANQDQINRAQIASGADTQTAGLRSTIQNDEQTALNQLYSTEDPTVAANTAQNLVANANLTKPILNPAGALFTPISVGVGNSISGFTNPLAYINPSAGGVGSTTTSTSSGGTSSGVNISGGA